MQGQTPKSLPRVLPSKRTGEMCAYNTRPQVAPSRASLKWIEIQYDSREVFSGGQDVRRRQLKSCGLFDQFAERVLHRHNARCGGRAIKHSVEPVFLAPVRRSRPFVGADVNVPLPRAALYFDAPPRAVGSMTQNVKAGMR